MLTALAIERTASCCGLFVVKRREAVYRKLQIYVGSETETSSHCSFGGMPQPTPDVDSEVLETREEVAAVLCWLA